MGRNQSRKSGISPAVATLEWIQKEAPKHPGTEWWTRKFLYQNKRGLSRKDFEEALAAIRGGQVAGWHYKAPGREAAYCVAHLVDQLPARFRPDPGEATVLLKRQIREHARETIDTGLREYHAAVIRAYAGPFPDDVAQRAIDPYWSHIVGLVKSGRLGVPKELLPHGERPENEESPQDASEYLRSVSPEGKAKFLLDVKAAL